MRRDYVTLCPQYSTDELTDTSPRGKHNGEKASSNSCRVGKGLTPVTETADKADVARGIANVELARPVVENLCVEHELNRQTKYGSNMFYQFLSQILDLI